MFAVALPMLLFAAQAPDRNCTDDRGRDRCAAAAQQEMRALYGVPPIEELAAAGAEVRRIFYVDGYGRDTVLIAFVRAPGSDPTLRVHYPRHAREERPEPLQAPVPSGVWNEVIERGTHFHRRFAAQAGEPDGAMLMCLHSSVFVAEAAERGSAAQPARIRRKTEDACEGGPAEIYAGDLQRIALDLIPHCAALDTGQHRNAAAALDACRILRGDRLAAAEALNKADGFRFYEEPADAERFRYLFADQTAIDWAGRPYRGRGWDAHQFWAAQIGSGRAHMFWDRADGLSADRVRLTGSMTRYSRVQDDQNTRTEVAAVEQTWILDHNRQWKVERAVIGPWVVRREDGAS